MRPITPGQAEGLRTLRSYAARANPVVQELCIKTCHYCDHAETDPDCPVCTLDLLMATVERNWNEYRDKLDLFLTRGPVPGV